MLFAFSVCAERTAGMGAGAELLGLRQVQVHPTGFIDPADPGSRSKVGLLDL